MDDITVEYDNVKLNNNLFRPCFFDVVKIDDVNIFKCSKQTTEKCCT